VATVNGLAYGPGVPGEVELRLSGDVTGKRVIELGGVRNAVAYAVAGAKAIAVTPSAADVATGRSLAEAEEVRVEFHTAEIGDLGFATSGSVDLVVAVWALAAVEDVDRVLRQVHRVLKPDAPFVFTVPHPVADIIGDNGVQRAYGSAGRTVSGYVMALARANFRVETMLEPAPTDRPSALAPAALVVRARKLGL
jgi:SAM-dependent methyltransferase